MPKEPTLSKASKNAFDDFDASAQDWGLQSDRGVGSYVNRSEKNYNADRLRLMRRIVFLERLALKRKRE